MVNFFTIINNIRIQSLNFNLIIQLSEELALINRKVQI